MDLVLFFLALVLIPISPVISQPNVGYYQIALRWPESFCNTRYYPNLCVPNHPTQGRFTLHGLWPDNTTAQRTPKNCSNDPYLGPDPTQLAELRRMWPNLLGIADNSLWREQWEKHGTCAYLPQYNYFNLALRLAKSVQLDSWLFTRGGMRIGTNTHNVTDIIFNGLRVIPIVKCIPDLTIQRNMQLSEVVVCYRGAGFINCPRNRWPTHGRVSPSSCPSTYILP